MSKVFIVMGTTGEYSDRSDWPVVAYTDGLKAQQHVEDATKAAKAIEVTRENRFDTEEVNEYDANMRMDYTGTDYFLYEVELND